MELGVQIEYFNKENAEKLLYLLKEVEEIVFIWGLEVLKWWEDIERYEIDVSRSVIRKACASYRNFTCRFGPLFRIRVSFFLEKNINSQAEIPWRHQKNYYYYHQVGTTFDFVITLVEK